MLCRDTPGAAVTGFEVVGGSDGTSSRRTLQVHYNAAGQGLPQRLFMKSASSLGSRLFLVLGGVTETESVFYNQVRPGLDGLRSPRAFHASSDAKHFRSIVLMEDLGFSPHGSAWKDVLNGDFDLGGRISVNPDGGLKSFGHPVGASGLRMLFECWLQFRGEAGERQLDNPKLGLTHNLGGRPGSCVSFVSVVGKELS